MKHVKNFNSLNHTNKINSCELNLNIILMGESQSVQYIYYFFVEYLVTELVNSSKTDK